MSEWYIFVTLQAIVCAGRKKHMCGILLFIAGKCFVQGLRHLKLTFIKFHLINVQDLS